MTISSIKDILGKIWRFKDDMDKNSYMTSNWSIGFNTHGKTDKKLFKYYYGNEFKEGTVISITQNNTLNVAGDIYNFGTKKYIDNYGNKPRIIIFNPDVTEEDITKFGWFGGNSVDELWDSYFFNWWNGNVEEVTLQIVLEELGDSIRNISGDTEQMALMTMSYNLDTAILNALNTEV